MTTLQSEECQTNDPNNLFPMAFESLRFPLHIVFTGYFNGFSVEVRPADEAALLYHMGCFGKGSVSRSKPRASHSDGSPQIMRKRQFLQRNYWYKKFGGSSEKSEPDTFFKEIDELTAKVISDSEGISNKDVIDLVSSEEENEANDDFNESCDAETFDNHNKQDIVVIVPNSDSEGENYFANMKPKCCVNKIKLHEKLMLTLQEAFFLMFGLGCLQVIDVDNKSLSIEQCWELFAKTDKKFISKYVVYHYFRSKGYIVKPGVKFAGDYLLYREGPGVNHADYIVVIKEQGEDFDWISIMGHIRMATTTVKEVLIAEVTKPADETVNLPEDLRLFSVREIMLNRKIPVTTNDD